MQLEGLRTLLTDEEILDIFHIIDTPSKLSRILSKVIDSNLFDSQLKVKGNREELTQRAFFLPVH
jgi:hypothetical protein